MKSSNGILLGFSELYCAAEVYFEVAKMFRRVYIHTYKRVKIIPWKFFFLAVRLELSLEDILCITTETLPIKKQKLDKKATGLQKGAVIM